MVELIRHIIPRRFICSLTYQDCCTKNCQLHSGIVEYIKNYLGCPSRTPDSLAVIPPVKIHGGLFKDLDPTLQEILLPPKEARR